MKFKIIHIHIVEADSRDEAMSKFVTGIKNGTVDNYFETMFVKKVENTGWLSGFTRQFRGGRR
jgi:hypothetical protein